MTQRPAWLSLLAAAVLALGLGGGVRAAGPVEGPLGSPEVSPTPPSAQAGPVAVVGWRLKLPAKSPLVLPRLDDGGFPIYPVKEAAVYGGLTVTWRASARLLELAAPDGAKARLLLGESYLFDGTHRVGLSGPLQMLGGAPALDEADLRLLLERLCAPPPVWEPASQAELAVARATFLPAVAAEPDVEPTIEPQLVATVAAHVAARPLTGRRIRTVVVDAGHGGYDPGAHGHRSLREKDVCLDIALKLQRQLLQAAPDLKVLLTRDRDVYLTLRQRTEIANRADADLFVSIHNNASPNRASKGSQVFFYDSQSSDRAAADLVMRENEEANQLEILMTDLAKSLVRDQSIGFAAKVQAQLGKFLRLKHRDLSYAPFYVLARTKMPAILVEVAFITHPQEEQLLGAAEFRQRVAESLTQGVLDYRRLVEAPK